MIAPARSVALSATEAPTASYLTGAVDDWVIRLHVPGGVVHDCTLDQARQLWGELGDAIGYAERAAQRDGRCPR